jgi:hypothetical protein
MTSKFKPLTPPPPSPVELVAAVRRADPATPPARVNTALRNGPTTLNLRLRMSSVEAISAAAESRGLTLKQVVTLALRDAGVTVAPEDLEDRSTKRRSPRQRARPRLDFTDRRFIHSRGVSRAWT